LPRHRFEAYLDKVFDFPQLVGALPEGRHSPTHPWEKVFDAVEHVVAYGLEHRCLGQIDAIGGDEIQYAKGHKYLTLVYQIDLGVTRLLWVGKERTIESFQG